MILLAIVTSEDKQLLVIQGRGVVLDLRGVAVMVRRRSSVGLISLRRLAYQEPLELLLSSRPGLLVGQVVWRVVAVRLVGVASVLHIRVEVDVDGMLLRMLLDPKTVRVRVRVSTRVIAILLFFHVLLRMSVFCVILASMTSLGICLVVSIVHLKDHLVYFVDVLMGLDVVRLFGYSYVFLLSLLVSIISLSEIVASPDYGLL